jgi:hypothetical protein
MGDALTEEIIPLILQRKESNDSVETADSRRIKYLKINGEMHNELRFVVRLVEKFDIIRIEMPDD